MLFREDIGHQLDTNFEPPAEADEDAAIVRQRQGEEAARLREEETLAYFKEQGRAEQISIENAEKLEEAKVAEQRLVKAEEQAQAAESERIVANTAKNNAADTEERIAASNASEGSASGEGHGSGSPSEGAGKLVGSPVGSTAFVPEQSSGIKWNESARSGALEGERVTGKGLVEKNGGRTSPLAEKPLEPANRLKSTSTEKLGSDRKSTGLKERAAGSEPGAAGEKAVVAKEGVKSAAVTESKVTEPKEELSAAKSSAISKEPVLAGEQAVAAKGAPMAGGARAISGANKAFGWLGTFLGIAGAVKAAAKNDWSSALEILATVGGSLAFGCLAVAALPAAVAALGLALPAGAIGAAIVAGVALVASALAGGIVPAAREFWNGFLNPLFKGEAFQAFGSLANTLGRTLVAFAGGAVDGVINLPNGILNIPSSIASLLGFKETANWLHTGFLEPGGSVAKWALEKYEDAGRWIDRNVWEGSLAQQGYQATKKGIEDAWEGSYPQSWWNRAKSLWNGSSTSQVVAAAATSQTGAKTASQENSALIPRPVRVGIQHQHSLAPLKSLKVPTANDAPVNGMLVPDSNQVLAEGLPASYQPNRGAALVLLKNAKDIAAAPQPGQGGKKPDANVTTASATTSAAPKAAVAKPA